MKKVTDPSSPSERKSLTAAYTTRTAQGKFHVTSRGFHDNHLRHPTLVFESTILHLLCDIFVLVLVASPCQMINGWGS